MLKSLVATVLLAASTALYAQAPATPAKEDRLQQRLERCKKAKDPAQCEARVKARAEKHRERGEKPKERAEKRKPRMEQDQKK